MSIIKKISNKPKTIFLIDGIGALISFISLMVISSFYYKYLGMPTDILFSLAVLAFFLSIYSFYNYLMNPNNISKNLKLLIIANISYCLLTTILIFYYFRGLTTLAIIYFSIEILIISTLVLIEKSILNKI